MGRLLNTLEETGFADDTVIVFTADHGDMLGERGMWFKMSWFENSARVPLVVHAPHRFEARRVSNAVSLVDLLPTFLDLAQTDSGGTTVEEVVATSIEGRSLLPHLTGDQGHDEAVGEYLAEGTAYPSFMIVRDGHKFISTQGDPDQLYDLEADPLEQHNLATDAGHRDVIERFRSEIEAYDQEGIRARVLESQARRAFLAPAMKGRVDWDFTPPYAAEDRYIRNTMPIYELERRSRFPHPE